MLRRLLLVLALAAFPISSHASDGVIAPAMKIRAESTVYSALEFANPDGTPLLMDLYVPGGRGPFPVIVSVHGGSWTTGTRDEGTAVLQVSRGYAVANIDYRLAPASHYPAQLEDCKAAVRWLRANAERFNLDANHIGAMGYSAGGHLAALLGTTAGVDELEGVDLGNGGYSSRVQAVVDYFGPTDLLQLAAQAASCEPGDPNDPNEPPSLLIGCPIQSCPDATEMANPIRFITPDDPPFLILHGTSDCLVPWQQSAILYDALRANGTYAKLILLPLAGHADPAFLAPAVQQKVNDFLDAKLKPHHRRLVRRAN